MRMTLIILITLKNFILIVEKREFTSNSFLRIAALVRLFTQQDTVEIVIKKI